MLEKIVRTFPALLYSFVQTALSEELFFRGFLTNVFSEKFGFNRGNLVQGALFGLLHGMIFVSIIGGGRALIITILTGVTGVLMGWINEKQSGGSIVSSWALHGISNFFASILTMFSLA